jgi:hypothetical protein
MRITVLAKEMQLMPVRLFRNDRLQRTLQLLRFPLFMMQVGEVTFNAVRSADT